MIQEQTTVGDLGARLIKLMVTLGGDNELMFAPGTIEQIQNRAYVQLPAAFNELLGTVEMLAQDINHDREAACRERQKCLDTAERIANRVSSVNDENAKLTELCKAQGKLIAELSE